MPYAAEGAHQESASVQENRPAAVAFGNQLCGNQSPFSPEISYRHHCLGVQVHAWNDETIVFSDLEVIFAA